MDKIIDDLQTSHHNHIKELTKLHEIELTGLKKIIESLRNESAVLRSENEELKVTMGELRGEVEGMRDDFDLIQSRLGKIILEEDDLVSLLRERDDAECKTCRFTCKCSDTLIISDVANIKKYLKKLEGSDPLHLCRFLQIPFNPPSRALALSSALLNSISAHLSDDPTTNLDPQARWLLKETIKIRLEVNGIAESFVKNSRKSNKLINGDISGERSLVKWLIEEHGETTTVNDESNFNPATIISSLLSNFK